MSDTDPRPEPVTTGRPLDGDGEPIDGPALELEPDGAAADLLRESPRPLASSPGAGTWATLLERPDEGATDRPRLLQWIAPDATEPPTHRHPTTEIFRAVEGELTVVVEDEAVRLNPDDAITVRPDEEHTFRNDTDGVVAFSADLPSMRTVRALYSTWGLDHEGAFGDEYGEPGVVHALLVSEALHGETTITAAPVPVQRVLWATVGRLARAAGYRGIDERFLRDAFWERHVEQPRL